MCSVKPSLAVRRERGREMVPLCTTVRQVKSNDNILHVGSQSEDRGGCHSGVPLAAVVMVAIVNINVLARDGAVIVVLATRCYVVAG